MGLAMIDYQLQNRKHTFNKNSKIPLHYSSMSKLDKKYYIFENNNNNNRTPSSKPFNKYYQKISKKSILFMNEEEKENYLYYILEQMSVPFEKLEKLLFEEPDLIAPSKDIRAILSTIIIRALERPDPVMVIHDNLAYFTRLHCRNKLITYVSKSECMDSLPTIEYLKGILSNRAIRQV